MKLTKGIRALVVIFATIMFLYQMWTALGNLRNPPSALITETISMKDIPDPLMHICPFRQFDEQKTRQQGYDTESHIIIGATRTSPFARKWKNEDDSFEDTTISFLTDHDINRIIRSHTSVPKPGGKEANFTKIFFPRFRHCLEITDYSVKSFRIDINGVLKNDAVVYITDRTRKTQFSFDFTSQEGVKPRFEGKKYLASGYWIDVEVYDYSATSKEDNCNPDPNYNFADCVDKKIHNDLVPRWNCVAPWLSSESHCSSVPFEKVYTRPNDMYDWFWFKYAGPFFYFQENWAQKECQKPCIL